MNIKVRYIVDKEHRKIICLLTNTEDALWSFIEKYNKDIIYWIPLNKQKTMLMMPSSFRGVATCAEGDEWDEELGKKIAYARARYKFDSSFFNHANHMVNYLDRSIDELSSALNRYGARISNNHARRDTQLKKKIPDFKLFSEE